MPDRRLGNILSISLSLMVGLFVILRLLPISATPIEQQARRTPAEQQQRGPSPSSPEAAITVYLLPSPPPPPPPAQRAPAKALPETQQPPQPKEQIVKSPPPARPKPAPIVPLKATKIVKPAVAEPKKQVVTKQKNTPAVAKAIPAAQTPDQNRSSKTARVAPQNIRDGRAMLRILEHGVGPVIDIAWPKSQGKRAKLYGYFVRCLGMTTAVINRDGDLFRNADIRNHRWELNLDRSSGFLRQPSGQFSTAEATVIKEIRQRHNRQQNADPVRIFPRKVDAYLLGGLQSVIGPDYKNSRFIRASYRLDGNQLMLTDIEADARKMSGRINLSAVSKCRMRA